jgi:L-ascorbate metabolism protein UlaG (beta-lactamase superfamily)
MSLLLKNRTWHLLFCIATICFALPFSLSGQSPDFVRYIGNMGILVKLEGSSILIDGLHLYYDAEYLNPPASLLDSLCQNLPPYRADVLLVTHVHKDHFHPEPTLRWLKHHPQAKVVVPQQVWDTLQTYPQFSPHTAQILVAQHGKTLRFNNLTVTPFSMPHTWKARHAAIQNFAFVVEKQGKRCVHFGDAASEEEANFLNPVFSIGTFDIAVVPSWFLGKESIAWTLKYLRCTKLAIGHLSPLLKRYEFVRQPQEIPSELLTNIGQNVFF